MKGVAVGAVCPDVGSSGEIARFFTVAAWGTSPRCRGFRKVR